MISDTFQRRGSNTLESEEDQNRIEEELEDQGLSIGVSTLLSPLSYPDSLEEEQVETQPVLPGGFENKGDRVRLQVPQPNQ